MCRILTERETLGIEEKQRNSSICYGSIKGLRPPAIAWHWRAGLKSLPGVDP